MSERLPWKTPIDITQEGASEAIINLGKESRDMRRASIYCEKHSKLTIKPLPDDVDREIQRHRYQKECYHQIEVIDE